MTHTRMTIKMEAKIELKINRDPPLPDKKIIPGFAWHNNDRERGLLSQVVSSIKQRTQGSTVLGNTYQGRHFRGTAPTVEFHKYRSWIRWSRQLWLWTSTTDPFSCQCTHVYFWRNLNSDIHKNMSASDTSCIAGQMTGWKMMGLPAWLWLEASPSHVHHKLSP